MDQPHVRGDQLELAALDGADEIPAEQLTVGLLLGNQLLCAVLPHQLDAGLGQRRQVIGRHVLDRGQDLDLGADLLANPLEVRPYLLSTHKPAWRPVRPSSRRWEK